MNFPYRVSALCLSFALFWTIPAAAEDVDVAELVKKCDKHMRGDSNRMDMTIHVHTNAWERTYRVKQWMKGIDLAAARVLEPARFKGQGFLKIQTRLWNYLPTAERTILIPPSLMLEDVLGSDFSNDDFIKMSYIGRDYTSKLLAVETLDGIPAYKVELISKPEAPVVYAKLIYWARQSDAASLKVEFYNDKGECMRTLVYSDFKPFNDREFPSVWTMHNHRKAGNWTTITVTDAEFNLAVDDHIFTKEWLENPE